MKKTGFTLAEVLITLTIIGVVAAVTIPALMHNTDKMQYTNGVRTNLSVLSNGFAQMKATEMVDSLRDTRLWSCLNGDLGSSANDTHNCVLRNLREYFTITDFSDNVPNGVTVADYFGEQLEDAFADTIRYTLPNGATINVKYLTAEHDKSRSDCETIKDEGGAMCGSAADIYLDVNGDKRPNLIGRDIYKFALSPEGKLFPAGGRDYALYDENVVQWTANCSGKPLPCTCTGDASYGLTARIIEDGYKIKYY